MIAPDSDGTRLSQCPTFRQWAESYFEVVMLPSYSVSKILDNPLTRDVEIAVQLHLNEITSRVVDDWRCCEQETARCVLACATYYGRADSSTDANHNTDHASVILWIMNRTFHACLRRLFIIQKTISPTAKHRSDPGRCIPMTEGIQILGSR